MKITNTLIALFVASVVLTATAGAAENSYISQTQCKVCHDKKPDGAQWSVWKEMKHANAFNVLKGEEAIAIGKERGLEKPPHEEPECLKCHVTAYDEATQNVPAKIKVEDGVQCETCHGEGQKHLLDGREVMFKKTPSEQIDWMANLIVVEESTCLKCHNEESPTWNPEKYTLDDGKKVGFEFKRDSKTISHPNPKKIKE